MEMKTTAGTARGVTTLMYVGDVGTDTALSKRQFELGAVGLLVALFAKGTVLRAAGAGVVGYLYARSRGIV